MPPFIAAMLIGAGAYAGLKAAHRILAAMAEAHEPARTSAPEAAASARPEKDLGTLEPDPHTGVYRPVKPSI